MEKKALSVGNVVRIEKKNKYGIVKSVSQKKIGINRVSVQGERASQTVYFDPDDLEVIRPHRPRISTLRECLRFERKADDILSKATPFWNLVTPEAFRITLDDLIALLEKLMEIEHSMENVTIHVLREECLVFRCLTESLPERANPDLFGFRSFVSLAEYFVLPETEDQWVALLLAALVTEPTTTSITAHHSLGFYCRYYGTLNEILKFAVTIRETKGNPDPADWNRVMYKHIFCAFQANHGEKLAHTTAEELRLYRKAVHFLVNGKMPDYDALREVAYSPFSTDCLLGRDMKISYKAFYMLASHYPKDPEYPNMLASLCRKGQHRPDQQPALPEARNWYRKAAALEDPRAAINLAEMYRKGEGGPEDLSAAIEILRKFYNGSKGSVEAGETSTVFRDVSYRLGQWLYEQAAPSGEPALMMQSLEYLLEADFVTRQLQDAENEAIRERIQQLIAKIRLHVPLMEATGLYPLDLAVAADRFLNGGYLLSIETAVDVNGVIRLVLTRKSAEDKKSLPVLWSNVETGIVRLLDSLVIYVYDTEQFETDRGSTAVVCNRYETDAGHRAYRFMMRTETLCRLTGGVCYAALE